MTDFSRVVQAVDKEQILSYLTEEQIYKRFCPEFPTTLMCSPLRNDKNPSFSFFQTQSGKWMWKDFNPAYGSGDVFDFVMIKEGVDFIQALRIIQEAFNLDSQKVYSEGIEMVKGSRRKSGGTTNRSFIQAVYTDWRDRDYEVWHKWNISPAVLHAYKIKVAESIWKFNPRKDKTKILWAKYRNSNPIYYWKSEFSSHLKCYRPLEDNSKAKWLSNSDNLTDVQGYVQCRIKEKRQPLILTKSMKEVMFFRQWGFNAMAGHTEGSTFIPDFIRHLRKYCHPIITVYDNDIAGIVGAMKMKNLYGIPPVFVCEQYGQKDPTDLWKHDYHKWYSTLDLITNTIDYYDKIDFRESADVLTGKLSNSW